MTQSFINPLSKFTSDTLKTLPYSRLYFYENQSSTPKQIYKDKNKTISWGFYAESDSAGNFPPIWFDGVCRAELRWSSNWATFPVGVVQTGWPIDHIGTAQTFDSDIVVAGDVTAENLISLGSVQADGGAGFISTTYDLNARNPIWSFGNAPTYGISYFAGTPAIGTDDTIGIHFGAATLLGSKFKFRSNGDFSVVSGSTYLGGAVTTAGTLTVGGNVIAVNVSSSGNIDTAGNLAVSGAASVTGYVVSASFMQATTGIIPGNTANAATNVLDYYLEYPAFDGTVEVIGSSTPGTANYTSKIGRGTRIGNRFFFQIKLIWNTHTGTGNLTVGPLPIAAAIGVEASFSVNCSDLVLSAGKQLSATLAGGATTILLKLIDPAGGTTNQVVMDAAGEINITGHYLV